MADQGSQLPNETLETISIATTNAIAGQPAILSNLNLSNTVSNINLSQQNAVSNQQAMNQIGLSVTGKAVNAVTNLNPLDAAGASKILTGNSLARNLADIKAAG